MRLLDESGLPGVYIWELCYVRCFQVDLRFAVLSSIHSSCTLTQRLRFGVARSEEYDTPCYRRTLTLKACWENSPRRLSVVYKNLVQIPGNLDVAHNPTSKQCLSLGRRVEGSGPIFGYFGPSGPRCLRSDLQQLLIC